MKSTIRQANPDDFDSIKECIDSAFNKYISILGRKPSSMHTDFNPLIREGQVFVIDLEDQIVAVMVMIKETDHIQIRSVAVNPSFQKQGFGKKLFDFAKSEARNAGLSEIRLYTSASLPQLINYWSKLGFKETERKVEGGYQRVFMSKLLVQKP